MSIKTETQSEVFNASHAHNNANTLLMLSLVPSTNTGAMGSNALFIKSFGLKASNEKPKLFMQLGLDITPLIAQMTARLTDLKLLNGGIKTVLYALCGRHNGINMDVMATLYDKKVGVVHPYLQALRDELIISAIAGADKAAAAKAAKAAADRAAKAGKRKPVGKKEAANG